MKPVHLVPTLKPIGPSKTNDARVVLLAAFVVPFLGGCAILGHFGESRPPGSGKILLTREDGPLLVDRRAIDKYTCGEHVRVCTQAGSTRFLCECGR